MDLPSVLIPAYKPDDRMIGLIKALISIGFSHILVVNDGSGQEYNIYFNEAEDLGCKVLVHAINMGKGRALKTGFNAILLCENIDAGVITADADGQHLPEDIVRIAMAMEEHPDELVLGIREFTGNMPFKNRIGNTITRGIFALVNGNGIMDTQTGLRGIPGKFIPLFLSLKGERYEYEMNMILEARPHNIHMVQVPIIAVYIEGNKSSHYRPLLDSARIFALIIRYIASSLFAGIVDYSVFTVMHISFPQMLIASVIVSRLLSSIVNFLINRNLVFRQKDTFANAAIRYYILVVLVALSSYGLIWTLSIPIGLNVYLAKIITDIFLWFISYIAQRELVYSPDSRIKIFKDYHNI